MAIQRPPRSGERTTGTLAPKQSALDVFVGTTTSEMAACCPREKEPDGEPCMFGQCE